MRPPHWHRTNGVGFGYPPGSILKRCPAYGGEHRTRTCKGSPLGGLANRCLAVRLIHHIGGEAARRIFQACCLRRPRRRGMWATVLFKAAQYTDKAAAYRALIYSRALRVTKSPQVCCVVELCSHGGIVLYMWLPKTLRRDAIRIYMGLIVALHHKAPLGLLTLAIVC